ISELLQRIQATGLLRRYAPRNDGPKNRTVQSYKTDKDNQEAFLFCRFATSRIVYWQFCNITNHVIVMTGCR
ncbi:hypothetical protein, partial [Legionella pneumophila]|uniref:hypothetical protein n=1 Tax=Legionella pneumophila TaxID=446 RepID=UPI001E49259B